MSWPTSASVSALDASKRGSTIARPTRASRCPSAQDSGRGLTPPSALPWRWSAYVGLDQARVALAGCAAVVTVAAELLIGAERTGKAGQLRLLLLPACERSAVGQIEEPGGAVGKFSDGVATDESTTPTTHSNRSTVSSEPGGASIRTPIMIVDRWLSAAFSSSRIVAWCAFSKTIRAVLSWTSAASVRPSASRRRMSVLIAMSDRFVAVGVATAHRVRRNRVDEAAVRVGVAGFRERPEF